MAAKKPKSTMDDDWIDDDDWEIERNKKREDQRKQSLRELKRGTASKPNNKDSSDGNHHKR